MLALVVRTSLCAAVFNAFILPALCSAQETFTGTLDRVTPQSITILLKDGRLVSAKLPSRGQLRASELASKYRLGEQVTVNFKNIPRKLDSIKFVRAPTDEEFASVAKSLDSRNLLRLPPLMWTSSTFAVHKPEEQTTDSNTVSPAAPVAIQEIRADEALFTGSLERIMQQSITILLADGRLVDAKLPDEGKLRAGELASQYHLGDQVSVNFKNIPSFWDDAAKHPCMYQLDSIKFLRRPNPDEFAIVLKSRDWRQPGNLLEAKETGKTFAVRKPDESAATAKPPGSPITLEQIRTVNLRRAAHLPNFIADEMVECYSTNSAQWVHISSARSEVTFQGGGETRKQTFANGIPVDAGTMIPGCMGFAGGFGTYLQPVFDTECPTKLNFSATVGVGNTKALVYSFVSPPDGCFTTSFTGRDRAYPTREGILAIEIAGGNMIHVSAKSVQFPAAYAITEIEEKVSWDFVDVGGQKHLLPVSYEKVMHLRGSLKNRVTARYINHRHFQADTNITFQQ